MRKFLSTKKNFEFSTFSKFCIFFDNFLKKQTNYFVIFHFFDFFSKKSPETPSRIEKADFFSKKVKKKGSSTGRSAPIGFFRFLKMGFAKRFVGPTFFS